MTTAQMTAKIADVLASDVEFIRWCINEFGKPPTIQIDFDERQESPDDHLPLIAIVAVEHDSDLRQRNNEYTVQMLAVIENGTIVPVVKITEVDGVEVEVTTRTYAGRAQVETLREQASAALYRGQLGKASIGSRALNHTYHPRLHSQFTVNIEDRS